MKEELTSPHTSYGNWKVTGGPNSSNPLVMARFPRQSESAASTCLSRKATFGCARCRGCSAPPGSASGSQRKAVGVDVTSLFRKHSGKDVTFVLIRETMFAGDDPDGSSVVIDPESIFLEAMY